MSVYRAALPTELALQDPAFKARWGADAAILRDNARDISGLVLEVPFYALPIFDL
jgi:hypothetical protein